jgi:uncharacterized membrane protein
LPILPSNATLNPEAAAQKEHQLQSQAQRESTTDDNQDNQPENEQIDQNTETVEPEKMEGRIIEILEEDTKDKGGYKYHYQKLKVLITRGTQKGERVEIEVETPIETKERKYEAGDHVEISFFENEEGASYYNITDYVRRGGLLSLFIVFTILAVAVASKRGLYSLISMALTFIIIVKIFLPLLVSGRNPILITVLLSIVVIPLTFYLSHGFKKHTTVAILSTLISLVITGILAQIFINAAYLRGFSSEDAFFLQNLNGGDFDLKGILLGGIIVGLVGILDDISIAQSSLIYKLAEENPNLSFPEIFTKSMDLGRNHIASMINTLILVYAGSSLPLMLLFVRGESKFGEIINNELIATEIVHTLIGSIGLIITVPITALLASYFVTKSSKGRDSK